MSCSLLDKHLRSPRGKWELVFFSLAYIHISCTVSRLADLGPADTCSGVLKVYGPVGIRGTGFGVELHGPVLFHVLPRPRREGHGGEGLLPRVLPHQAATATSGQWRDDVTEHSRCRFVCSPTFIILFELKKQQFVYKALQSRGCWASFMGS